MNRIRSLALLLIALIAATALFWLVIHQIAGLWLDVALRPEVRQALERSLDDQKRLRALDDAHQDEYRQRFESTHTLLNRLEVIRINRAEMLQRFELTLVGLFALVAGAAAALLWIRYRRTQALERQQYIERVAALQETARRQVHELKGPLTAARMVLENAGDLARRGADVSEISAALESVAEELERLSRFTREYASFAAVGAPVLRPVALGTVVAEFCSTFANAWPDIALRFGGGNAIVCADPDMLRQVLVNLCTNAARATPGSGTMTFSIAGRGASAVLDVSDTGSGIPESLRARIFNPYVTTCKAGEGMGLGLAISRKIMLEHGGDLQLLSTSSSGSTFRLTFGEDQCN